MLTRMRDAFINRFPRFTNFLIGAYKWGKLILACAIIIAMILIGLKFKDWIVSVLEFFGILNAKQPQAEREVVISKIEKVSTGDEITKSTKDFLSEMRKQYLKKEK